MALTVQRTAGPSVDTLSADLPQAAPVEASPGDPVELTLDSGEKDEKVFTGVVASVDRRPRSTTVRAVNAGGLLARARPSVTYELITAGNLIKSLCDEVGVEVGEVEEGETLAFYAADSTRSGWEHVCRAAGWNGAIATVSSDNRVQATVVNAQQAEVALRYGREVLDFSFESHDGYVDSFTVNGEGGAGEASAPEAMRPTTDFFAGSRPEGPSERHRWSSVPALRTVPAAATAAAAQQRLYESRRDRGHLEAFLQPDMRPGGVIEIQDLPGGLGSGPFWISRVEHTLGPRGGVSRIDFAQGGDSFDPMAMLGSLLGAVGGLL
jgi:hypothetical protein